MNKDNQLGQIYKFIILTGLVLFGVLVGYKIISSHIQESKGKAVIQEEAKVQQEKNQQLDACISQAEQKRIATVLRWTGDFYPKNCVNELNMDAKLLCEKTVVEQVDKAKAEEQIDKKDCYARYK